jgi:hypothetical protein
MIRRTSRLVGSCLFALLLLPLATPSPAAAGDGWWGDLDKGQVVELRDIMAKPRSFRGKQLTFFCVVRGPDNVYFPQNRLLSRARYANFTVWPDGTALWDAAAYANAEFPTLYISRTHPDQATLMRVPRYTRIEVTGSVRALVGRRPCLEIASWRESGHRLGREVVDSMVRARAYVRGGDARLARSNFRQAMAVDLPSNYRVLIEEEARQGLQSLGASLADDGPAVGTPGRVEPVDPGVDPFDQPLSPSGTLPASGVETPGSVPPPDFDTPMQPMPSGVQPPAGIPGPESPGSVPPPNFDTPMPATPTANPGAAPGSATPLPGDPFLDSHLGPIPGAPSETAGTPEGGPGVLPAPQPTPGQRPGRTRTPPTRPADRVAPATTPPTRGAPPKRRPRLVGVR